MTINVRMLTAVLFLIGLTPLWAQNQRLTWEGDEYAMRYEVVIEQEKAGKYHNVLREFTEESFIEVSLPSGKYRCQVIPYDFLNQPVPVTEWIDFEVFHDDAHSIALTAPKNRFDLYLSLTWISILPLYIEGMEDFDESKFFGEYAVISPFGAAARFGMVSAKRRVFSPGMELTAAWRIYADNHGENIHTMQFDCNMIEQTRFFDDKIALNLRLGAGVSLVANDESLWSAGQQYSTHISTGASLFFSISQNFFMETGAEYSQLFTKNFFCFFRSWIGLGYRF